MPFVAFGAETDIGHQTAAMLRAHGVEPAVALATNIAPTVCAFVAAGTEVALVHPLMLGDAGRLVVRPFEPRATLGFVVLHDRASRNARLVAGFISQARATAAAMLREAMARQA